MESIELLQLEDDARGDFKVGAFLEFRHVMGELWTRRVNLHLIQL